MGWVFWLTLALKALEALLSLLDSGKGRAITQDQVAKLNAVIGKARLLDIKAVSAGLKSAPEA